MHNVDPRSARLAACLRRVEALRQGSRYVTTSLQSVTRVGDARDVLPTLGPGSIQTIVTSPPYYAQRAYDVPISFWPRPGNDHRLPYPRCGVPYNPDIRAHETPSKWVRRLASPVIGKPPHDRYAECVGCGGLWLQLGLEPTPDLYVRHLVEIFRLCKDVLADDGTLWVVIGDSYAGSGRGPSGHGSILGKHGQPGNQAQRQGFVANKPFVPAGMKTKDLMDIPHMLGQALRADGWYWRGDIIWFKTNGLGSNALDRPSHSYENVLLFAKSLRYLYNDMLDFSGSRRLRDVWPLSTAGAGSGHTAAFPPALADICISLGSRPGDTVLDPFAGSGTTGKVAKLLDRAYVGIELGASYVAQSGL